MARRKLKKRNTAILGGVILVLILVLLFSCGTKKDKNDSENVDPKQTDVEPGQTDDTDEKSDEVSPPETKEIVYEIDASDEGEIISYASQYYRYGPSIMKYEDGSYDAWFSSPGNSGSQWDWITYRHSDDGVNWSEEEVVLKPTPGSKDQCSVCDPAVIYFNGYYYLGYTATDYYDGQGSYNMAFVARSEYPDGPFHKWNGGGWGGSPEPIIFYDGGKDNWGIGEVSFVIKDEDLFIYYSYIDVRDSYIGLYKADLVDDWPGTMRDKGPVLYRLNHDSVEVVYDEKTDDFFAFSIDGRMLKGSNLTVYNSKNGKDFSLIASTKENIEDYAHNMGAAKSPEGWIDSDEKILIGYAYGKDWGRWNTKVQNIKINIIQ